jgi:hypothetical protein
MFSTEQPSDKLTFYIERQSKSEGGLAMQAAGAAETQNAVHLRKNSRRNARKDGQDAD